MENWYERQLMTEGDIIVEAGMKENAISGILASIVFVLTGSSIYNAAIKSRVSEQQVAEALQDRNLVDQAKRLIENQKYPTNDAETSKPMIIPNAPLNLSSLANMILRHEGGIIKTPYRDSRGLWTIGVGFNLEDPNAENVLIQSGIKAKPRDIINGNVKLSEQQLKRLFNYSLEIALNDARNFAPNFDELPSNVKMVLVDMSFNLGYPRLNQFRKLKSALAKKDFEEVKKEMQNSRWYSQVKSRGEELVNMI